MNDSHRGDKIIHLALLMFPTLYSTLIIKTINPKTPSAPCNTNGF